MTAEEFSTGIKEDPNKATTRILLNRAQFSRVIGKSGQTIAHVRATTGVYMKGTDVDEDNRLVQISGSFDQVVAAFDMVTDYLVQGPPDGPLPQQPPQRPDGLQMNILLEHTKAGKAVGSKGSMMQTIKGKSGASSIRIEKEPMDIVGQVLRKLTIEGNIVAVRRAHLIVLELYAEPAALQMSAAYLAYLNSGGTPIMDLGGGVPRGGPGYGGAVVPFEAPMQQPSPVDPNTGTHMVSVPFPQLVNFGVQAETVRQLTEMKAYLWRHFGLDLAISREVVAPQGMPMNQPGSHHYTQPGGGRPGGRDGSGRGPLPNGAALDSIIDSRGNSSGGPELIFHIPKTSVGAVIGRAGANLRDLQVEHGVKIYIEKDDYQGKRTVVLSGSSEITEMDGGSLEVALQRCREHIERIVDEQLRQKASQGTTGGSQQTMSTAANASGSGDIADVDQE